MSQQGRWVLGVPSWLSPVLQVLHAGLSQVLSMLACRAQPMPDMGHWPS